MTRKPLKEPSGPLTVAQRQAQWRQRKAEREQRWREALERIAREGDRKSREIARVALSNGEDE